MRNASKAIPKILVHEGGFVNHPSDPGGATNKGITIATFRRYIKPSGTISDLKALTTDQAVVVYKRQYWDAVNADLLPDGVDYAVADFAVNSGPSRAAKYLQKVAGVSQDGRIGPDTIAAVRAMPPANVINLLCDDRLAFMRRIQGGKLWVTFGRGWQRRVDDVRSVSLQWAKHPLEASPAPDAPPTPAINPQGNVWAAFAAAIMKLFGKAKT
tara:strand:+ start:1023 stop:1661 length:639 start_codon:yes stop_codon:yes gene_type:complete